MSRRTTLLPLGLKSADGEAVPDGPSSGAGVGSRCCIPSPRTKAILSSSEEEEVASMATVTVDVDAIWPTGDREGRLTSTQSAVSGHEGALERRLRRVDHSIEQWGRRCLHPLEVKGN
jgi:hypothetical protein